MMTRTKLRSPDRQGRRESGAWQNAVWYRLPPQHSGQTAILAGPGADQVPNGESRAASSHGKAEIGLRPSEPRTYKCKFKVLIYKSRGECINIGSEWGRSIVNDDCDRRQR